MNKLVKELMLIALLTPAFSACNEQTSTNEPTTINELTEEEQYYELSKFNTVLLPKEGTVIDCYVSNVGGASSGTAVTGFDKSSSSVSYTIDVPYSTYYLCEVRYSTAPGTYFSLYVNELDKHVMKFDGNYSFKNCREIIKLNKGKNTLRIRNTQGQGYGGSIDTVTVKGFETPASVAQFIENTTVYDVTKQIEFKRPIGFNIDIVDSTNENIINKKGEILDYSSDASVSLQVSVSRNTTKSVKNINVMVKKSSPTAKEMAEQIYLEENLKYIPSGKTNIDFPEVPKDTEIFMVSTSNDLIISRNGVVNAKKDDSEVKVKYLIRKLDGSEEETKEIAYIVKGLGFDYSGYFENPLGVGQDPYSIYLDGYYYHIRSVNFSTYAKLEMTRTTSPIDYKDSGFSTIYVFPSSDSRAWNCLQLWGPFPIIKWSDGCYYIYYSACDGNNINHRQGVIKSKTSDPFGEYEDLGIVNTSDLEDNPNPTVANTCWAIGATTYQHTDGQYYLTWSGWKGYGDNFPQRSYIAKIIAPNRIGKRVEVSQPTEPWEGGPEDTPIQEGQAIIRIKDTVFLLYSANSSWAGRYRLGMLIYNEKNEGGLLNPSNWTKLTEPVFVTTENVESPGGPTIVQSPDGKEYWLMYHCSIWKGSGWTRCVCAKPIRIDENNLPILDDPVPFFTPMRTPSGDNENRNEWETFEAEEFEMSGSTKANLDNYSRGGEYVNGFLAEGDYISFKYNAKEEGQHSLRICYRALTDGTTLMLKINNKFSSFLCEYRGENTWVSKEVITVLKAGENTISLNHSTGYDVDIDFVGVKYNGEQ